MDITITKDTPFEEILTAFNELQNLCETYKEEWLFALGENSVLKHKLNAYNNMRQIF